MAMFGASGREKYDALYSTLQQPADTTALERQQTPRAFEGDIGGAAVAGGETAVRRAELLGLGIARQTRGFNPSLTLYGIDQEIEAGVYGEGAKNAQANMQDAIRRRQTNVAELIKSLRPDPKTNGMASQLVFGITDALGTVALTGGNPYLAGATWAESQYQVGRAEGLDSQTSALKASIEGLTFGLGVKLPASVGGNLATRIMSGGAINAGVGLGQRVGVSTVLNARGYSEMARQYDPLDATSAATDFILGAAFGGVMGPRAKPPKYTPPPTTDRQEGSANVKMTPVNGFASSDQIIQFAEDKLARLIRKRDGTKDQTVPGPDGKPITIPGEQANFLSPAEMREIEFLEKNKGNANALAKGYGFGVLDSSPSSVDAALTANQNRHAEIDTAPGIPTNTRSRQAHNAALDQAVESLVMGRDVNVEALLQEAGFLGRRPDFDALRVIADELEKAGAADVVAQVRALEAEAKARGLVVDEDTIGSVVLSDKPVETTVTGVAERDGMGVRIGEDKVPTQLVLVEAGDVQATMMKADNQFRDRTRVASEQQIADIAARLDAALLMDAPVMDYGAPVLAADGTVIGGNGRAAAVNRAYEMGTADEYRAMLREQFGDAVDTMAAPMMVRVLQKEVDIQKAAILSNEGGGLRMSALEQAKVDADRLGDLRGVEFTDDGMADMTTVRSWVGQMPQNQRAAIMDADGRLSAEGATRLRNAVLYKAYGDSPTLSRLVEATDPGSRNIAAALTRAAPAVADAKEAIARGDLYPMGLDGDLIAAVEKLDGLRREGMSVDDWTRQIDAFGDGMSAEARLLVQFMDRNIRASRTISDGIYGFYNRLNEAGNPKQGSMFEAAQPDKMRMLTMALDEPAPMYSRESGALREVDVFGNGSRVDFYDDKKGLMFSRQKTAGGEKWTVFETLPKEEGGDQVLGDMFKYRSLEEAQASVRGLRISSTQKAKYSSKYGSIPNLWSGEAKKIAKALIDAGIEIDRFASSTQSKSKYIYLADGRKARMADHALPTAYDAADFDFRYGGDVAAFVAEVKDSASPAQPDVSYGRGAGGRSQAADLDAGFRAMFGRDADRLMDTARVRIVQSVSDLPGSGHPSDVGGMFWKGEAWVVADNTGLAQIRGRVLHEIGEHAGMEQMLGADLYAETLRRIEAKVGTDPVFKEARALAEARANRPEHVPAETLAYLVENAPELPLVRRVLAQVRQWLYRVTGGRFVDLSQVDLQMMAVASLRRYAREAEVAAKGEDAPWYMTLFHGTPNPFKPEPGAPMGRLRWAYINTGEGAQAFGYGHYLAQQEWIARTRYRDRLVSRKAKDARIELPYPGDPTATFVIDESTGPGFRVGDKIVHPNMPGELGGIGWVIQNIKQGTSVEEVRNWATTDLAAYREALARIERKFTLKKQGSEWVVLHPDGQEAERGFANKADAQQALDNYNAGFSRQSEAKADHLRDQIARAEGALRALDEVTAVAPTKIIEKNGRWYASWKDSQGLNLQDFGSEGDARAFEPRALRPDIQEVRPEAPKGALYGKFIPDETWNQMMIWDAPLSAQPENVRAAFERFKKSDPDVVINLDGEDAYRSLATLINEGEMSSELNALVITADMEIRTRRAPEGTDPVEFEYDARADEYASVILGLAGIPGHRFLDGETRASGWDSPDARFNVVLYSDDLGRVAWEARNGDTEWVTANGRARIVKTDDGANGRFAVEIDGKEIDYELSLEPAMKIAEQALDGQLYSRTGQGDRIPASDPLEDTTLPDARLLSDQADAEIATAEELSQGFLPAVECFLRAGE